jgi:uncharacterized membrane protein YphA (DoxX/SURF4 family)
VKPWVLYSLLRVGIFVIAFALLVLLGFVPWLAAVVAAVIGLCVSYLFLGRTREAMSEEIYARRNVEGAVSNDEEAEDRDR